MLQNYKKATLLGIISYIVPAILGVWFRREYMIITAVATGILFIPCVWLYLRGIKGVSLTIEGFYLGLYWVVMYLVLGALIIVLFFRVPIMSLKLQFLPLEFAGVILGSTGIGKFMGLFRGFREFRRDFREFREFKQRSSKQDT